MKSLTLFSVLALAGFNTVLAANTCTVSSVKSCIQAITSTKTRTASLTSFCSSVLGCVDSTTTLTGTVTSTTTILEATTLTFEFLDSETTTTTTFTGSYSEATPTATFTSMPTWTFEKFVITTVAPQKRDWEDAIHPKDLEARANPTSICPSSVQKKACSCLITCPPVVTRDKRRIIRETTTETSYTFTDVPATYTNIEYIEIPTTTTEFYIDTVTSGIISTHTRTIKCTPNSVNPSFYLQATNAPTIDGQYYYAYPSNPRLWPTWYEAHFTPDQSLATVFTLDSKGRLVTPHLEGQLYANIDYFNSFQLVHLMTRAELTERNYLYLYCEIRAASGNYPGGYGELFCRAEGVWQPSIFNYCPLYEEFFNAALVLGNEWSESTPDCWNPTFLVKPVCS